MNQELITKSDNIESFIEFDSTSNKIKLTRRVFEVKKEF